LEQATDIDDIERAVTVEIKQSTIVLYRRSLPVLKQRV
jgi:spermidine synthase